LPWLCALAVVRLRPGGVHPGAIVADASYGGGATTKHRGEMFVRLSASIYNDVAEYDRLADAMLRIQTVAQ
jgi:hypothetical protein